MFVHSFSNDIGTVYLNANNNTMNSRLLLFVREPGVAYKYTAGNRHKQNSRFCKDIREDNFRFWWRRVESEFIPDYI
jgi:hypothetical protein